jgi:peroxiredoxin
MTDDKSSCPYLERGQIIPAFSLPGTDGMPLLIKEQRMQTPPPNPPNKEGPFPPWLKHRGILARFCEERCALLAITADPVITNIQISEELHLPFPLLADVNRHAIPRYTYYDAHSTQFKPCIVLADRYNALYEHWIELDEMDIPASTEIFASLRYLNSICTP